MKKTVIFILISFAGVLTVKGQNRFTLSECVHKALNANPEVRTSLLQTEMSRLDMNQDKAAMLPSLNLAYSHNYNSGRSIDRFTNSFENRTIQNDYYAINTAWTLFNGFQMQNSVKQAKVENEISNLSLEVVKNQTRLNVASAYLAVLMSEELVKNGELQMGQTQIRVEQTKRMVDAGAVDRGVLLNLESQLASENLNLVNAQNQLAISKMNLKNLMLMDADEEIFIEKPAMDNQLDYTKFAISEVYKDALTKMPEVMTGKLRIESAEYQRRIANGMRSPTVSLFANMSTVFSQNAIQVTNVNATGTQTIGYVDGTLQPVLTPVFSYDTRVIPYGNQVRDNYGQSLGISVSWNLFNGFYVSNMIKRGDLNIMMQDAGLKQTEMQLFSSVSRAVTDYNASWAQYNATIKAADAAKVQSEFAEKRFQSGLANTVDYLNAKNQYLQSEIQHVRAKYELLFNRLVIEFYKGNEITL